MKPTSAQRQALRDAGYSPIPVQGKVPAQKAWEQKFDCNPNEIASWERFFPHAENTGILTRNTPTIDIDILNPEAAEAIEVLAQDRFEERGHVLVRIGQAPKRAILLRTDAPFKKTVGNVIAPDGRDQKIELLGDGQQVVVFGIHPDTGKPYSWPRGEPGAVRWEHLPYVTEADARAFVDDAVRLLVTDHGYQAPATRPKARAKGNGAETAGGADWAWLIANCRDGRELHDSICALAAKLLAAGMNDAAAVNVIRGAMQSSTTPHDDRWRARYDDIPRAVSSAREKYGGDDAGISQGPEGLRENPRNGKVPRFRLVPFREIKISTAPAYLVKDIIPRRGLVIAWGPPKCGKSFWTLDITMHVALGWNYRGRRVQQGPIVYLALEGGLRFNDRVEAWRQKHLAGHSGEVPFYLLGVPVDIIADHPALISAIAEQLGGQVPVVVVIDTLNRGLAGDENKGDDKAKFIRAADAIRAAFGSAVLIVHHCGIQGSRPRGHTSLSGADDAQIAIERDSAGNVMATVEHVKDGEAGAVIVSRLVPITIGMDDDGDPITSCVVVEAPAAPAGKSAGKTTPNQKRFLDILREAILEAPDDLKNTTTVPNGLQAVTRDMLKRYCVTKGWMEEAESNRARAKLSEMLNVLAGKNLVGLTNMHVWVP
jgi:hypothetical protein